MTSDALLLIGRRTTHVRETLETQATRLERRTGVDAVRALTYGSEPIRELQDELAAITADRVFAVPMCAAHSFATLDDLPAALTHVSGSVHCSEPIGASPLVTDVLEKRAAEQIPADDDVSLVLVSFGSSSKSYHRQTTEYHASRLRERLAYAEVVPCYLLQNPTVECVRYNVSTDRAVAVPLFVTRSEATEEQIPAKLELDRGGIAYADPLGDHARLTDAIHAEFEKLRALVDAGASTSAGAGQQASDPRPVATDGEGPVH